MTSMICPECGSEYREGYTHCADCDVDLVEPEPEEPEEPEVALVEVYATSNPALVPVFESILNDAGIEFMTDNAAMQNLYGGSGSAIGVITFFVREDAAAEAREIAERLDDATPVAEEEPDDEDE